MADKIVLSDVKSGFNIAVVNDNFSKLEQTVNDRLLWRDQTGIVGDNALKSDIDVNSKRLYNLPLPISDFEPARKKELDDALAGTETLLQEMQDLVDEAEAAVVAAGSASRLTAGTTTSGPLDVEIVGAPGSQVLNLTIPPGTPGVDGAPGADGVDGDDGRGIASVIRTSGTGAPGSTDTYTITYTDATTSTFQVYNGNDGAGAGDVVGPAGGVVDGEIVLFNSTTGKAIKASGQTLSALITTINGKQATLVSGTNIKTVNSTTLLGSGNLAVGDVTGPGSSVNNQIAVFSGTTGKVLADGGKVLPTGAIVGTTDTQTLTNKRINPRVTSETSSATPTINTDNSDLHRITALAVNVTSFTTNLSGTPVHGQGLLIEITGTAARTLAWGASFEASTIALPTTTVTTSMLSVAFTWNSATSKWRCIGVA